MTKLPKNLKPLRQVRDATRKTQRQFARLVGIGYDLYQSLEIGRVPLTNENARKILLATGALPSSLNAKLSKCATSIFAPEKPYCRATWEAWSSGAKKGWEQEVFRLYPSLIGWTQLVCLAAREKKKFWQVFEMLTRALEDIAGECRLDMGVMLAKELKQHVMNVSYTYGELRANPALAKSVGFKNRLYEKGEEVTDDWIWKGKMDLAGSICWDPSGWMPTSLINQLNKQFRPEKFILDYTAADNS